MNVSKEVVITLVATTVVLFLLVAFIIAFVFFFRQKQVQYKVDKKSMEEAFQQELLQAQLEIQEQTLQHISHELHDNIGQILSLVKINLTNVEISQEEAARQKLATTRSLVVKAISDLRALSKTLNADYVLHSKLSEVLLFELNYIRQVCGCETDMKVLGTERVLEPRQQLVIFRIAQEALNNAVKYALPTVVSVELAFEKDFFRLQITDNGQGFDPEVVGKREGNEQGSGLQNMKTRARLIGARFEIKSQNDRGTSVSVEL